MYGEGGIMGAEHVLEVSWVLQRQLLALEG